MNAKKCDRCAKLYEDYRDKVNHANAIRLVHRGNAYEATNIKLIDLCPECLGSFKLWLKIPGRKDETS